MKYQIQDQGWADHAVVQKYRDMVMNQWSNVFYFQYHNIIGLDKGYDELHEMVVLKTEQNIIDKNRIR